MNNTNRPTMISLPSRLAAVVLTGLFILTTAALSQGSLWHPTTGPYGVTVMALAHDGEGSVYAATLSGLYRRDSRDTSWGRIGTFSAKIERVVARGPRIAIEVHADGLYMSTDRGVTWKELPQYSPGMYISRAGRFYFGMGRYGHGFSTATDTSTVLQPFPFLPRQVARGILSITENRHGDILLGTDNLIHRITHDSGILTTTKTPFANVHTIATDSSGVAYAATDQGLFRSTDDGTTWLLTALGKAQFKVVAVGPQDVVYAITGKLIFNSTDHGATWQTIGWSKSTVTGFAAADDGSIYAGMGIQANNGIYRSEDRGGRWASTHHGIPNVWVYSISNAGADLYASSIWNGLYHSTDDGDSWTHVSDYFLHNVALHPDGTLWGVSDKSIHRSTDLGRTWYVQYPQPPSSPSNNQIRIEPNGTIFVSNALDLYRSTDNGASWKSYQMFNLTHVTSPRVTFATDGLGTIYAGIRYLGSPTPHHIRRSTDGGESWQTLDSSPVSINAIALNRQGHIMVLTTSALFRSTDQGATWSHTGQGKVAGGNQLLADTLGNFYNATDAGVWRFPIGGNDWELIATTGLYSIIARAVAVTRSGRLLAGIYDNGVFMYGEEISSVDEHNGKSMPPMDAALTIGQPQGSDVPLEVRVGRASDIELAIYDSYGNEVALLAEGRIEEGVHCLFWNSSGNPSGVYLCRLRSGHGMVSRRIVVVR